VETISNPIQIWLSRSPEVRSNPGTTDLELYKFHSCELCRDMSRRKLFEKIPSLPLALEIVLFESLP